MDKVKKKIRERERENQMKTDGQTTKRKNKGHNNAKV
jgi:hypothetical protein